MRTDIINNQYYIIYPQKTTVVFRKVAGSRPGHVGQDVFDISFVCKMMQRTIEHRTFVLLLLRLGLSIKQQYIMGLAMEEIFTIPRIGIHGEGVLKLLWTLGFQKTDMLWYLTQVRKNQAKESMPTDTPMGLLYTQVYIK